MNGVPAITQRIGGVRWKDGDSYVACEVNVLHEDDSRVIEVVHGETSESLFLTKRQAIDLVRLLVTALPILYEEA